MTRTTVLFAVMGSPDPRDSKRTMFRLQSPKPSEPEPIRREIVDTIVPKTTVEERLKFVDMEFAQEVEKFVEVPEVFYNDVIVEVSTTCPPLQSDISPASALNFDGHVSRCFWLLRQQVPQVVEVVKIVPKEEIRENITYVPRFETKYIPKYVEVPIIKIVDRYEEVDEIQEVLKPVVKKSVVDVSQNLAFGRIVLISLSQRCKLTVFWRPLWVYVLAVSTWSVEESGKHNPQEGDYGETSADYKGMFWLTPCTLHMKTLQSHINLSALRIFKTEIQSVFDLQHQDVPVYKRKLEPKIIKEDLVNQTPHFIDIPVPYEKPLYV